jgi:hypothetical protein
MASSISQGAFHRKNERASEVSKNLSAPNLHKFYISVEKNKLA